MTKDTIYCVTCGDWIEHRELKRLGSDWQKPEGYAGEKIYLICPGCDSVLHTERANADSTDAGEVQP